MTSSIHSGLDESEKPCMRVLAPPGGGSSIVFGEPEEQKKSNPVNLHTRSDIFCTGEEELPVRQITPTQKKDDSKDRLFGSPSIPIPNSTKNLDASHNKLFGEPDPVKPRQNPYKKDSPEPTASLKRAFNPITGLPYTFGDGPEPQNDDQGKGDTDIDARNSNRVSNPPGGRSSGPLW